MNSPFRFDAFYKYNGQFYHHPYTLRTQINPLVHPTSAIQYYPLIEYVLDNDWKRSMNICRYEICLYVELKRLQRFDTNDLKRYFQVIDQNIDNDEELHGIDWNDLIGI